MYSIAKQQKVQLTGCVDLLSSAGYNNNTHNHKYIWVNFETICEY